jgi:hypothetical protein
VAFAPPPKRRHGTFEDRDRGMAGGDAADRLPRDLGARAGASDPRPDIAVGPPLSTWLSIAPPPCHSRSPLPARALRPPPSGRSFRSARVPPAWFLTTSTACSCLETASLARGSRPWGSPRFRSSRIFPVVPSCPPELCSPVAAHPPTSPCASSGDGHPSTPLPGTPVHPSSCPLAVAHLARSLRRSLDAVDLEAFRRARSRVLPPVLPPLESPCSPGLATCRPSAEAGERR